MICSLRHQFSSARSLGVPVSYKNTSNIQTAALLFFLKKNKVLSCFASTEYVGVQAPPVHVLVHQDPFAGFVAVGKEAEHIPVLLEPGHELHLSREIPDDYVRKIADRFQPLHGNGSPG